MTGKAFYDIGHAPADHSNRRSTPKGYAVWEIHPVIKMEVIIDGAVASSTTKTSVSYNWNIKKVAAGAHTIIVKAYYAAGNTGQSAITVTK